MATTRTLEYRARAAPSGAAQARHAARRLYRRILAEFPNATAAQSTERNHVRERKRQMGLMRLCGRVAWRLIVAALQTALPDWLGIAVGGPRLDKRRAE
jgi:hypothetical protein